MPIRFWDHPCCPCRSGSRFCRRHHHTAEASQWGLAMHEAMFRYQLRVGWLPIGPHREVGEALLSGLGRRCDGCGGVGLRERDGGERCEICPSCHGFAHGPYPGDPIIGIARARVAERFPGALTDYDPATAARRLACALSGPGVLLHDLEMGTMVCVTPDDVDAGAGR